MNGLILYQIYPRSFKDGNDDGVGDIKGIIEKLDYLESLGINAIWISPIYPSPMADFGYDVSDFCDIDPVFGNLEEFDELVEEAHKRKLKVFMDYVINHTSTEHPWFIESRSSRDSQKRDWYIWHDPVDGHEPNNWISHFEKSAWTFDEKTGQYYMHSFLWAQPDLNWGNPEVVEAMKKVMRFWFDRGLDGFRLDSANYIWKQKHFMDEPENPNFVDGKMEKYLSLSHIYTKDQDEVFPILEELSRVSHEYGKNKYLIVEAYPNVWGRDAIVSYQKYYERLDSNIIAPFNFEFIFLPWDAEEYRAFIDAYLLVMADRHQPLFVLGNHDRPRIASRLGEDQARVAAMLILTLPGIPIIYNGEELGMTNVGIPSDRVQDPFAKRDPLFGRDPFRTPMQWEGSKNAGFSKGDPWLPIGDNYKTLNAEIESNDKMSVLNLYRNLLDLRKKSEAINKGEYKSLMLENQNVYGFMRHFGDEKILILLNFSHEAQKVDLDFDWGTLLYSTRLDHETCIECDDMKSVLLRPNEGCIYSL